MARARRPASTPTRWSEEFQANVYRQQLTMLRGVKHLRGICPGILVDFRSPLRELPGIRDFYSRKGPISDQGQKKQAFS